MIKNMFYFSYLNSIGGVENMFYELSKKYKDWDIVIYYSSGDQKQIDRLKKYVRVKKYCGEKIECEKAFFNYHADIINNVIAKEYYMIIHADYKAQKVEPPKYNKITKYIGVSQAVCDSFEELTGHKCILCYNPITLDPPTKTLKLVSATRLTKEKGRHRMASLANALQKAGIPFEWEVYTNSRDYIDNPNVIYKNPTLDINEKLKDADYVVQLSDSESYCYTMVEALMLGTPVIVTPWGCLKELGIDEKYGFILPFDMSNIPVYEIYNKEFNFNYTPPADYWDKILAPGKSEYIDGYNYTYLVKATHKYKELNLRDAELDIVPEDGFEWIISYDRYLLLSGENDKHTEFVTLVKRIPKVDTESI